MAKALHNKLPAGERFLFASAPDSWGLLDYPGPSWDQSYEQMLDQITKVRQALVTIAASRKQIELQEQQLQHSVAHLQDQTKAALSQGREDLAREALSRKAAAQAQIDAMEPQHQQLTEQVAAQRAIQDALTRGQSADARVKAAQDQVDALSGPVALTPVTGSAPASAVSVLFRSRGASSPARYSRNPRRCAKEPNKSSNRAAYPSKGPGAAGHGRRRVITHP